MIHAAIGPFGLNRTLDTPGCGFLHIIRDVAVGWQPNDPLLVGHKELITAVAVDAEHDLCASSSLDGTVRLWDARARGCEIETLGEQRPAAACNHHGRPVCRVDAKGGLIATFVAPRTVKVWDPRTPRAAIDGIAASPEPLCIDTFKCGTHEIRRGVSAFDGTGLLSLDGNGPLACASANGPRIWDLRRTAAHVVELLDDTSPVCALAFGAGGRDRHRLVTGCARGCRCTSRWCDVGRFSFWACVLFSRANRVCMTCSVVRLGLRRMIDEDERSGHTPHPQQPTHTSMYI